MKKAMLLFVFLTFGGIFSFGAQVHESPNNNFKPVRISFKIVPDTIIGGYLTNIANTLTPTADSTPVFYYGAELEVYLFEHFGLFAGFDFGGTMKYLKQDWKTFTIANLSKVTFGVTGKFNLFQLHDDTSSYSKTLACDFKISAGGNYGFFDFTGDYTIKFTNTSVSFYTGPAPGLGFFAGAGFEFLIGSIIVGADVYFNINNYKYFSSPKSFDMITIEVPVHLGLAF